MATTTYLAQHRVCRPSIDNSALTVYTAEGWLNMERYNTEDIINDLEERGVTQEDLEIIDNHYMIMNDGVVVLSTRNTVVGAEEKAECLARVRAAIS